MKTENTFKTVAVFQYSAEALIFKGKLEAEGIPVYLFDNNTIDVDPLISNAIGGVKLIVTTDDFQKANAILTQLEVYPKKKRLTCPNCGIVRMDSVTAITNIKTLIVYLFSVFKTPKKCLHCSQFFELLE